MLAVLMLVPLFSPQLVLFKVVDLTGSAADAWHATAQRGMEGGLPMSSARNARSHVTSSSVGKWQAWDRSLNQRTSAVNRALSLCSGQQCQEAQGARLCFNSCSGSAYLCVSVSSARHMTPMAPWQAAGSMSVTSST